MNDVFGDRMKGYEDSGRFDPCLPIIVRADGKSFSRYTRDFDRPWDARMTDAMCSTTRFLVEQTSARIGYTQSDEITLVLYSDNLKSQVFFDGKKQKIISVVAAMATAHFNREMRGHFGGTLPDAYFDARAFTVPSKVEAANALLWRELDATRNSVSMLAHHHFHHRALLGASVPLMKEMLAIRGVVWTDAPSSFTHGTYYRRMEVLRPFTAEELARIPEAFRPAPETIVARHAVGRMDVMPDQMAERVALIFGDMIPPTTDP